MADMLKATPRNRTLGSLVDAYNTYVDPILNKYEVLPQIPLIGGMTAGDLGLNQARNIANEMSYGNYRPFRNTRNIQTMTLDPDTFDVATMVPIGGLAAKVAKPVAKVAGRTAAEAAANKMVDLEQKYGLPTSPYLNIVKPEGPSNWLPGGIERVSDRYKTFTASDKPEPINKWIDTRLNKYVRNEMATESDPLRALAEQGRLHYDPPEPYSSVLNEVAIRRQNSGFPAGGSAENNLARKWEVLSDYSVQGTPVETIRKQALPEELEKMPWLEYLGPEELVYNRTGTGMAGNLGFDHMVDELKNAVDPLSTLPQHLRLTPKQLEQLSVPRASEHVAKINDWRTAEAARAEREGLISNLSASTKYEDTTFSPSFAKEPGGKWVDIPETVDEKGIELCTSIGKAGGWCTQGKSTAKQYGSGENRLVALLDAEGRPHVQATIRQIDIPENASTVDEVLFNRLINEGQEPSRAKDIVNRINEQDPEVFDYYFDRGIDLQEYIDEAEQALHDTANQIERLPSITELKPVSNSLTSDRALEYAKRDPAYAEKVAQSTANFLNSKKFGKINSDDLEDLGLVDLYNTDTQAGWPDVDLDSVILAFENAPDNLPRIMTNRQFKQFIEPYADTPRIVLPDTPTQGFAAGGMVASDYDDEQIDRMSDEIFNFEEGGIVDKIARYGRKGQYQMANLIGIKPEVEFATVIPERYYPANEQHNARGDAMRHMLLQAQLMQKYGETPAKIIGWLHENLSGPQGDAEKAMDEYNDRLGREIGRVAKDKADMAYRAMQAIEKKQAKTLTKEQMAEGYAEGGLVYNDEEINNLADQLLGA